MPTDMEQLIIRQENNVQQMNLILQQFAGYMAAMDQRIKKLEKMNEQRVTISHKQAKALQKRVLARAGALCEKHGLNYPDAGKELRKAIWSDLKTQYTIDDIHDLPAVYFELAAQLIDGWTSYSVIRKLRARHG